jgi:hypothetical protein
MWVQNDSSIQVSVILTILTNQATKADALGGNSKRKRRERSGVEELLTYI